MLSIVLIFFYQLPLRYCFLLLLPLILDGTVQLCTRYESNNALRFATGVLFGFGFATILLQTLALACLWGYRQGKSLRAWMAA